MCVCRRVSTRPRRANMQRKCDQRQARTRTKERKRDGGCGGGLVGDTVDGCAKKEREDGKCVWATKGGLFVAVFLGLVVRV